MNKIILTTLLLAFPLFCFAQESVTKVKKADEELATNSIVQIADTEIASFIRMIDEVNNRDRESLSQVNFDSITAKGKEIFKKGMYLPERYREDFIYHRCSTQIGTGPERICRCKLLNRCVERRGISCDRFIMTVEVDNSGKVLDFYWDKPIDYQAVMIEPEQLEIFMRYVYDEDFYSMKYKGLQLFKQGRLAPKNYKTIFADYLKEEKEGTALYEFYYAESDFEMARIRLKIDPGEGKIIFFDDAKFWNDAGKLKE